MPGLCLGDLPGPFPKQHAEPVRNVLWPLLDPNPEDMRVGSRGGVKFKLFPSKLAQEERMLALNGMVSLTQKLSSTKIWATRKFAIQKSVT